MKKKFIQKEYWQKTAEEWEKKGDPVRPSYETTRLYNDLIQGTLKNKNKPKVCVLGATPEIRDMLYKYSLLNQAQIFCLDWVSAMYHAMSQLTNYKNKKEKFIKTNWLKIGLPDKSIDVFIGDFVLANIIKREDKETMLGQINRKLKNGGYLIMRNAYIIPQLKINNLKNYLRGLGDDMASEKFTVRQAATTLFMALILSSWYRNKERHLSVFYWADELNKLKKYFAKKNLSLRDRAAKVVFDYFIWLIGDYVIKKCWVQYPKLEEEKLLSKYFVIKKKMFPKDCKLQLAIPVYLLQKRNIKK